MAAQLKPMGDYTYTVQIEPAEEGGFNVLVPALPGCVTQGDTYEEAVAMAQEVIEGFVEALVLAGEEIPVEPQPVRPTTTAVRVRMSMPA